jgi:hypothetical protein
MELFRSGKATIDDPVAFGGGVMKKSFDCVEMKDRIQQKMRKQMEGLSGEQRRALLRDALDKSVSPIGDLWRALGQRSQTYADCVAETGSGYGNKGPGHIQQS